MLACISAVPGPVVAALLATDGALAVDALLPALEAASVLAPLTVLPVASVLLVPAVAPLVAAELEVILVLQRKFVCDIIQQ